MTTTTTTTSMTTAKRTTTTTMTSMTTAKRTTTTTMTTFQRLFSRKTFWIYFTVILLLIVLPINKPGSRFNLNDIMVVRIRGDYLVHALVFIPWAFFMRSMDQKAARWLIYGLIFSTGTELLQYLLPYRRFNINDLISNSLGIIMGMVIVLLIMKRVKQRLQKS